MKDILKTYQDRLINLSTSNRSLVLKKIYKKRSFDIFELINKKMLKETEFFDWLFSDKIAQLSILKDPLKMRKTLIKEKKDELENARKKELEQLKTLVSNNPEMPKSELDELAKKEEEVNARYDGLLALVEETVAKDIEALVKYSNDINYLSREINAVEKETGKYELFIGYPFVEGKFNDGTPARAPLMLIPVILNKKNNIWSIKVGDADILINKVFLYGYAKYNEIALDNFDTTFSSFSEIGDDVRASLLAYLKANKVDFSDDENVELLKFKDMRKEDFDTYENGDLIVKNYAILGQFPLSNSIYTDYEKMVASGADSELLRGLLINQKAQAYNEKELSEKDTFFYTGLDFSQEQAVKKLFAARQLVIYGPPGTGKSYTISNIITDALCKGQRVLMVSKKKVALDVIYNKLADVNGKIALVHDGNKDKKKFYEKVKKSLGDKSLEFDLSTKLKHEEISEQIDKKLTELKVIEQTLMHKRDFGLSLQEMYVKTNEIKDVNDERFPLYKAFRNHSALEGLTYEKLLAALKIIAKDENVTKDYSKYREISDGNDFVNLITNKFDLVAKDSIREKGEKLLAYTKARSVSELYGIFGKYYYENKASISESIVDEFATEYNDVINGKLVEDEKAGLISGLINKMTHGAQMKENRAKYDEELSKYKAEFAGIYANIKNAESLLNEFCLNLDDESKCAIESAFYERFDISKEVSGVLRSVSVEPELKQVFAKCKAFDENLKSILDLAYDVTASPEELKNLLSYIEQFLILDNIREIEQSAEFDAFYLGLKRYLESVDQISALMKEKNDLTSEIAKSVWNDGFQVYLDSPDFKEFKRQAEKKRQLWPVRKYIENFSDLVFALFPCWLLSPETVSEILPLSAGMFDIIIFDEASQIFIEDAIPTIYRGDMIAIAGDDKQLKPTSIFSTKFDYFEEEKTDVSNIAAFEEESLLDLAKVNYPSINLNYHYRSRYAALINFSNYAFYGGELNIAPDIAYSKAMDAQPIEFIKVEGVWEDRKNSIEASAIVELVADILKNRKKNETIGIISFNINQKDLIEDLLESKARRDEEFAVLYEAEKQRLKGNEDVSIFVKNIENVQGDERDIIIFSIGYAKNAEGKISVNFGSLSQDGGENRLNVAISRSKRKIYVVSSIEPDELKVAETLNNGPKLFKSYLKYAKAVSNNDEEMIKEVLKSVCPSTAKFESESDEFVSHLAMELEKRGHKVIVDAGASRSKIDLAIINPDTGNYILGVECDGNTYKKMPSVRERDIHRKRFLEFRGWEIIRVWSRDWWEDKEKVISEIEHFLSILIENEKTPENLVVKPNLSNKNKDKEGAVTLGNRVFIKDLMTGDSFDVNIEEDENKLNEFKLSILGKVLGEVFEYKSYEYQVVGVKK